MAGWKYAPVAQEEGAAAPYAAVNRNSNTNSNGGGARFAPKDEEDNDTIMTKRMPYCLGMLVLLAIIYVLSRTENSQACDPLVITPAPGGIVVSGPAVASGGAADFDIGAYRRERLAATPPHIIECAAADEGASQEVCHLPRDKRFAALRQKGATLWMTGLSGSGKSTIATALEEELVKMGKHVYRLDGDNIRTGLNRDLGFSADDRDESVRRVGELACLFSDAGVITLVSLVSPYREARDAVRKRHEEQGILFFETFMDVPLDEVKKRDPKGLYAKVEAGELKGFTGVDAPYEAPLNAEIVLPNRDMTIDECVRALMHVLEAHGIVTGGNSDGTGLPMPDGDEIVDLHVPSSLREQRRAEAETLPKVLLTDIDLNWLQTIGEGWASPLKGFMREGTLLQTIHFNSYLVDPHNVTGQYAFNENPTNFSNLPATRPPARVSMSVPIVLPCTGFTKAAIESSKKRSVALVTKDGQTVAILRNAEIYVNRKEEIVTRIFGVIDPGHPYISHIYSGGDWLIGGEVELLDRIRYNDGLDKWRLTAREVRDEFAKKGADVVYAFQTRNPTHAGHAYLMRTAGEMLKTQGYKRPVLWLSPLGGWTKADDVPLDVRIKQHEAVLNERMLDPTSTVMAIWPSPMIYAGPTEVIFHAKSRRSGGASYFVVGRDPAGMKGSDQAVTYPDDDLYDPEHGRYVLAMSPGVGGMKMLDFAQVYYDKKTHTMTAPDSSRPADFISISGSKMRALARQGARPCPSESEIPSDLLAANCVPPGFMVETGWDIVCDYYQNIDVKRWVPWSKPVLEPFFPSYTTKNGEPFGTEAFSLHFRDPATGVSISPWHDIPLVSTSGSGLYNFVVEIPMYQTAKMEVSKTEANNPIMQDVSHNMPRYYSYGVPFFNYGLLPQTWEDPSVLDAVGHGGDNDPLDVMEIGDGPLPIGTVTPVKVLGSFELIDEGETDFKIIAIRSSDPLAPRVNSLQDLENHKPGVTAEIAAWLKNYKTSEGKGQNVLASEVPGTAARAVEIIQSANGRWKALKAGETGSEFSFWLGGGPNPNDKPW